jgi:Na+-transporting methylmalonyl-CoA/oxaloacetate decarboxylase gamma subunit
MTINLLASIFDNFGENALWGGFTFILGIAVIFLGMTILVLSVSALGKIISSSTEKPKKKTEVKIEEKVEQNEEPTDDIPEHVRVAIIAAISAYYLDSGSKNEFKVKKIKKI